MPMVSIILIPLLEVLNVALTTYMWIVIIAAVMTWVNPDPYNPIVRFFYSMTEPVFSAIRRRLPFSMPAIDFTPMLVILAIIFLQGVIAQIALQIR
jgi:YggT family protein